MVEKTSSAVPTSPRSAYWVTLPKPSYAKVSEGLLARRRLALEEQAVALDELRVDLAVVLVSGEGLS
jgi:hypothetical protein